MQPEHNYYRVETFGSVNPYIAKTTITLNQLIAQLTHNQVHDDFDIYYHWKLLEIKKYGTLTLKQIADEDPMEKPVFYCYSHIEEESECELRKRYAKGVHMNANKEEMPNQYWTGSSGHILFDTRNAAILASSVNYATSKQEYKNTKQSTTKAFQTSMIQPSSQISTQSYGLIKRVLSKLGLIKKNPSSKNLHETINTIKGIKTKQQLEEHCKREYSDYDPKFATYLEQIYLKFAILSAFKLHYVQYKKMEDGVIGKLFYKDAKIGIIGDFGTGLSDSLALLTDLIVDKGADIILHLGDVYYAGTPHQYENNVVAMIEQLRVKTKRQILFYSIPGNHDYYSWGLPYLCFIKQINSDIFTRQIASYFCLRSQDDRWQFIGLDTAYHDSNPLNQINGASVGPSIRKKQIQWFKDKMQTFPGSTILLTHHQLFSIHERICGEFTSYRHFSCINPLLSAQLFEYIPHISGWFWGHEHSYMLFDEGILGAQKCRLLGNSSFHVFEKENPYVRKKGFPFIPFVKNDDEYYKKYLPVAPSVKPELSLGAFYNLCYAIMDFSKSTPQHPDLPIEYFCCPCYMSQNQKQRKFKPYSIFKEQLRFRKQDQPLKYNTSLQIKSQIGLCIQLQNKLTLGGSIYRIVNRSEQKNDEMICDGDEVQFVLEEQLEQKLSVQELQEKNLDKQNKQNKKTEQFLRKKIFLVNKKFILKDASMYIRFCDTVTLREKATGKYLCCEVGMNGPYLNLTDHEGMFMFLKSSKIRDCSDPYANSVMAGQMNVNKMKQSQNE